MGYTAAPLEKLIEQFSQFPGIGRKGATRMAYQVLSMSDADAAALAEAIQNARVSISGGENISGPLEASGVFPTMVTQMIAVGEETGGLDEMLIKVADFYDEEVNTAVAGLASTLEPVMIVLLGGFVGALVIAMYLPIFDMVGQVGGS